MLRPRKKTLFSVLFLLGLVSFLIWILLFRPPTSQQNLIPFEHQSLLPPLNGLTKVDLMWQGQTASFEKSGQHWQVVQFNGSPTINTRCNENLLKHLLESLSGLQPTKELPAVEAPQYGLEHPTLGITMAWRGANNEFHEEAMLFGSIDEGQRTSYLFMPRRNKLYKTSAAPLQLLKHHRFLDFRDRHLTTFTADDVEDLKTTGPCGSRYLWRNGDHWEWKKGSALTEDATNEWLNNLTQFPYSSDISTQPQTKTTPWCILEFMGRLNRHETLRVYKNKTFFWSENTAIPGQYELSASFAEFFNSRGSLRHDHKR